MSGPKYSTNNGPCKEYGWWHQRCAGWRKARSDSASRVYEKQTLHGVRLFTPWLILQISALFPSRFMPLNASAGSFVFYGWNQRCYRVMLMLFLAAAATTTVGTLDTYGAF